MAYRLVFPYAFVRGESEQNSSLQLLQVAAVEVLPFSSLGCSLDQFPCTRPCHVIGGDSDTSASIKRCEPQASSLALLGSSRLFQRCRKRKAPAEGLGAGGWGF